jgi:hypothetical protein
LGDENKKTDTQITAVLSGVRYAFVRVAEDASLFADSIIADPIFLSDRKANSIKIFSSFTYK